MRYISQVRYITYAILKTKKKRQRPSLSNIICTVEDRESEKPRGQNNTEVICVLAFGGRVGGGLAPMAGKLSYPFQLVFNSLLFSIIS